MPTPLLPPVSIVFNAASGAADVRAAAEHVGQRLTALGQPHTLHLVQHAAPLATLTVRAVHEARARGGIVVVAGGDGSIHTVAQAVWNADLPLGVLPLGTFNYFARAHGIGPTLDDALDGLLRGAEAPVSVGLLGEQLFLVNAAVGLYPRLLLEREQAKARFGRHRVVALLAGLGSLLRGGGTLTLQIGLGDQTRMLRARMLFVGNNPLQLAALGLPEAENVAQGELAAVALRPVSRWAMAALMLRGALGRLDEAQALEHIAFEDMTVQPVRALPGLRPVRRIAVAMDGEVSTMSTPLRFRVAPRPLRLWRPPPLGEAVPPPGAGA